MKYEVLEKAEIININMISSQHMASPRQYIIQSDAFESNKRFLQPYQFESVSNVNDVQKENVYS